jgi:hypothetical protein
MHKAVPGLHLPLKTCRAAGYAIPFSAVQREGMPTMYAYKTADEIIGSAVPAGPEFVERDVENQFRRYQEDPDNKVPALEALVAAFAVALLDENQDPNRDVPVPLWVVQELGPGLIAYHDDLVRDPNGPSLEQRLGIRSSKAGGHRQTGKEETVKRNMNYALEVAQMIGPNPEYGDVEKAIKTVREKQNVSRATVLKAWSEHGDIAWKKAVEYRIWDQSIPNHDKILP